MIKNFQALRFLLFRYLVSSWMIKKTRTHAAVGVFLPILGVGIGVCFFTVILSVMGGFVAGLKGRLLGLESHIEIVRKDTFGLISESEALLQKIERLSPEILAVAPFQKGDAIIQSNNRPATVVLLGLDPARSKKATSFDSFLVNEHDLGVLGKDSQVVGAIPEMRFPSIALGRDIVSMLGVDVGDRVTLLSVTPEEGPGGLAPKQVPVVVADVLSTGSPVHDAKIVLTSVTLANSFFGTEGQWAGIQLKVREPTEVDALVPLLDAALANDGLRAKPWTEANKALLRALKLERMGMSFVLYMVILVGCFSITITLVLAVKRKSREMAILRAMGLEKRDLGLLYLAEGCAIGILGVTWGLLGGLAILQVIKTVPLPFLTSAYNGKPLPVLIDWTDIGIVGLGSVFLAMFAAVWPAFEVMRIDVVETLSDRT